MLPLPDQMRPEREKEKETDRENDRETESTRNKMWEQAMNSALAGDIEKTDYNIIWYTLILYKTEPTDVEL